MTLSRTDVIVHPVRLRILVAIQGRNLTPKQLAAAIPDVPQATLYRHIHRLVEAGMLIVVEERQVHGAVERVYAMPEGAGDVSPQEFAAIDREDHERYFMIFVSGLVSSFRNYIRKRDINVLKDGLVWGEEAIYVNEEEFREWQTQTGSFLRRVRANPSGGGRRRVIIAPIVIPDTEGP
jgi:DNA-binding transcriptional ArsR family regulator